MHPGKAIDASWDGDRSIQGRQSMHPGLAINAPGMAITASLVGDQGWQSIHPGIAIGASRDGNRCTREDDRSISGWRAMHPVMAIDASREGNRSTPGWHRRSQHPGMASGDGDHSIPGWRSRMAYSVPDWRSMHLEMAIDAPGMTIAASLDGDHFLPG